METKLWKLLGLSPGWAEPALYFGSSATTISSRGQTAIPELDFETINIPTASAGTSFGIGHGHATTIEVITLNSVQTTVAGALRVFKIVTPTTSVLIATIQAIQPAAGGNNAPSFFYRACGPFGWVLAPSATWATDATISFTENILA